MSVPASVVVGSHVWVEDPEVAWLDGVVVEVNGEEITVDCSSGKTVTANLSNVYAKDTDAPSCGVDDMTKLSYLHEPGVLQNLRSRYDMNEIYMIHEGISQSILVSGESGAGKTESTKMLMQYLAYMGGRAAAEGRSVEQQVLESNPVLEAFGNAKTVRNNNSSRFGKFVELQFDKRQRISGAAIRTYLLERSRVCQVSDPERNYHCFYLLCAAPPEDVEKYKVGNPRTFHYLNQSNFFELAGVDESEEYLATRRAMDIVGISHDEQDAIFRVVAAILHLGNIEFAKGTETDASEPKDDKSRFHLKIAAELFMCDEKSLEDSMCKRVMVTRDETITKSLDPEAAALSRDALSKIVYSRLFDWIVNKINNSIGQDPDSTLSIGVLDIYGFESFKTNSFEQFCINLTNEKLQQHFNQHVFKMEQEEYTKEEIDWSYIEFIDNQDILDLIEKKPGGIIALLDEACMFPRSTYETFAEKLYQTFKDHKRFSKPKLSRTDFTICHYAGDVTYQTEFFLDKNKDFVVPEHQATLIASRCHFVAGLFPPLPEDSSKQTKFSSIGARFKQQLQSLLETLNATEPHYVRCVKPNNLLKPEIFENQNVLQQLRCGGVLEAIRISCAGYPTRKPFDEFLSRFKVLAPEVLNGSLLIDSIDEVAACRRLLEKAGLKGYQVLVVVLLVGKTKVFLRAGQMAELDTRRNEVLGRSASIIQGKVRTYFARKKFMLLRVSAIQIQAVCRGQLERPLYECMRREAACLRIQKDARKYIARKSYVLLCVSAISIQAGLIGMAARNELQFRKRKKAATFIQSDMRRYLKHRHYRRMKKAAVVLQCAWRSKMARRELRKLKMAAKETGALQEAKSKLEKEVEELTQKLEVEKRMRDNLEEAKTQETKKLQSALEEMRLQLQETKELLKKEREAATKAFDILSSMLQVLVNSLEEKIDEIEKKYEETVRISQERLKQILEAESKITQLKDAMQSSKELLMKDPEAATKLLEEVQSQVADQEVSGKITAENEQFKVLVNSLEKKIDETEKKYEETSKLSEERLKQALDSEAKIIELKLTMQRLEEKLSDIEDQQILRQQALHLPTGRTSSHFTPSENGHHEPLAATPSRRFGTESMRRSNAGAAKWFGTESMRRSTAERQRESVDILIKCMIGSAIEDETNNNHMAYWLSNGATLLFLLQHTLKTTGSAPSKPPQPTSFFGRMAQSFRGSSANLAIGGLDTVRQVEAKQPALLFKMQLSAYVEKIYGIIRDNWKKDLSSLLASCIQASQTSKGSTLQSPGNSVDGSSPSTPWDGVIESLNGLLSTLKENYVHPVFVQKILNQIFSYVNVQLFNSLLLQRECCTFSNGEYVKAGLQEIEHWCGNVKEEYVGSSLDELKHVRQAVGFLVINQKSRLTSEDLTTDLCPILSSQQLYRMCTLYWDEDFNTQGVSPDVISSFKDQAKEDVNDADKSNDANNANDADNNFVLDDNSSIPISVEDINSSLKDVDFTGVKPANELLENAAFQFLCE
ncbi:hypothetical protein K7X08_010737 [Anisodus acutangulus]|uniref:Uncharacterized protein n=1 Tax=Anisodus acutangulus TaxID=402998 RepID=A0A9Q1M0V7_9SOLA|nr:hypothetical protein K7X08_010737 [Anisodus acutangulus]